jgi:type I restriction enzyme S subunit
MSLPAYPAYRESGVPWLGRVPAHWTVSPIKHVATFTGGGTPSRDVPAFWNGHVPWVSPKDMKAEVLGETEEHITDAGLAAGAASLIDPNAVLICVRSGILRHTIPVAINERPVALNQDMKALRLDRSRCEPRFVLRLVQGMNDLFLNLWLKQGATVESIEQEYLARTEIPLPPPAEQRAIAAFLDRECGKIDALVAEQERLIALLKEKRQAVISHAVTKSLDPSAPMKDSGVPWLGRVPAHWGVRKLRDIAKLETGHTPSRQNPEYWIEEDCVIPWFTLADVSFLRDDRNILISDTSQRIRACLRRGFRRGGKRDSWGVGLEDDTRCDGTAEPTRPT